MLPRRVSGWGALVLGLCIALCVPRRALAAALPPTRVSVLTMGPGDHPFTRFGHNAILLEWDGAGQSRNIVYNFGTFEFDGLQGATDFMAGRFRYWLSVGTLEGTLRTYAADNRSLTAQELALTPAERSELLARLADNALPEHRYYDYDYYRDNCSTRVRDAIDQLLGGELKGGVLGSGRLTYRQHTLRLVGDTSWLYFGLDVALGARTDRPTTRWEELFLPEELHDSLARATRKQGDGTTPLVRVERQLLRAQRAPLAHDPPERRPLFALYGALAGSCLAALGALAARGRAARALFGGVTALLGAALGLLGVALTIFSLSKHWAAHDNASLLACPPWALALTVLGASFALKRQPKSAALVRTLGISLIVSGALLVLSLVRGSESLRMALLFCPLWAGWYTGARLAVAPHPSPSPPQSLAPPATDP
jgi:hypothetical protein